MNVAQRLKCTARLVSVTLPSEKTTPDKGAVLSVKSTASPPTSPGDDDQTYGLGASSGLAAKHQEGKGELPGLWERNG